MLCESCRGGLVLPSGPGKVSVLAWPGSLPRHSDLGKDPKAALCVMSAVVFSCCLCFLSLSSISLSHYFLNVNSRGARVRSWLHMSPTRMRFLLNLSLILYVFLYRS